MNNNISSMTMTIEEFSRYFTIKPTLTVNYDVKSISDGPEIGLTDVEVQEERVGRKLR